MAARSADDGDVPLENVLSVPPGLYDHLLWQLHLMSCPKELLETCEFIIGNLDEDGLLRATDEEITRATAATADRVGQALEIELGVTGGEEDGVDNTGLDNSALYTQPEDVALAYERLSRISPHFTVAASFGNVHGVYKPGNVQLTPKILDNSQRHIQEKFGTGERPVSFVFHGGSGSAREEIREAISYGVVKMNIDTDTQWAAWDGVRQYVAKNHDYLQGQIGNPEGDDKPNKKYYDPRKWLRAGEQAMVARLLEAFEDLNCMNRS